MINKSKIAFVLLSGLILSPVKSFAEGGISLGATRVIYQQGASQATLPVTNTSPGQRYLINSWVENAQGQKDKSFVITPPLFVSEASTENTLRLMYVGAPLPSDKESIFYLDVKAIPSVDSSSIEGKNVLQLAILSRIKLFVRPKNLPFQQTEAAKKLSFAHSGSQTTIHNPTPYYVTMVNVTSAGKKVQSTMVAPFSDQMIAATGSSVTYQSVNDYGGLDKPFTANVK